MGDMSDFHLEEVVDAEHDRALFHSGWMGDQEAFDKGFIGSAGEQSAYAGSYSDYSNVSTPESLDRELGEAEAMLNGFSGYSGGSVIVGGGVYYFTPKEEEHYFTEVLSKKYSKEYTDAMIKELKISGTTGLNSRSSEGRVKDCLHKLNGEYPKAYEALDYLLQTVYGCTLTGSGGVDHMAVKFAQERLNPTCNICLNEMSARNGRYGKFYYCLEQCEGQPTVSDTYWQQFKSKVKGFELGGM